MANKKYYVEFQDGGKPQILTDKQINDIGEKLKKGYRDKETWKKVQAEPTPFSRLIGDDAGNWDQLVAKTK